MVLSMYFSGFYDGDGVGVGTWKLRWGERCGRHRERGRLLRHEGGCCGTTISVGQLHILRTVSGNWQENCAARSHAWNDTIAIQRRSEANRRHRYTIPKNYHGLTVGTAAK